MNYTVLSIWVLVAIIGCGGLVGHSFYNEHHCQKLKVHYGQILVSKEEFFYGTPLEVLGKDRLGVVQLRVLYESKGIIYDRQCSLLQPFE